MKLSDFKDEKGVEIAAKLLPSITNIVTNEKTAAVQKAMEGTNGNLMEFASAMLQNSPRDVMNMLAILHEHDKKEYHCSAATVLVDTLSMITDPDLLALFGLQGQTPASSGSASENTEAPAQSARSSATRSPNRANRRKKKRLRST